MRIILVSGLSGAGKSVVLHALEDMGCYCVDNLPASMLEPFVAHTLRTGERAYQNTAIAIDARDSDLLAAKVPETLEELRRSGLRCELLVVLASDAELLRRFGQTKRRHPLIREGVSLQEAIGLERELLDPVVQAADLVIDTSDMGMHALGDLVGQRIDQRRGEDLSVTLVSFGFKFGIPGDCDFVLDARILPNPYWESSLRALSGRDAAVIRYLNEQPQVQNVFEEYARFIRTRIDEYRNARRRYLTIGIGCTGGQHRSVYLVERLTAQLASHCSGLVARHTTLASRAT